MAKRFTDLKTVTDYIKTHCDILKVITEDTGLQPAQVTTGNNFIFCPFHDEKNKPSFNINVRTNTYKCFGCHESGDIVKWVQQWSGASYPEALEQLASRTGLDLTPYVRPSTPEEVIRDRYQFIMNTAAEWCNTQLVNHDSLYDWYKTSESCCDDDDVALYKVGYCPSVDAMVQFLFNKIQGITQDEIHKLELGARSLFNNALVYPVRDITGNVARIYTKLLDPPPDHQGKYHGTSNSHPLFRKDLIYGLWEIRKDLRKGGHKVTLCEGHKACIAANGIAVMGTNASDEQVELLRTIGIKQITTCFDGDQAGFLASMRVVEDSQKFRGMIVRIARMPMDTQCDTLVKARGRAALDAVLSNAVLPIEFLVQSRYDTSGKLSMESKYQLLADVGPIVAKLNNIEINMACEYLASVLGAVAEDIRDYIRDLKTATSKLVNTKAEESVLHHVLVDPIQWSKLRAAAFAETYFSFTDNQKIYKAIESAYNQHNTHITARAVVDAVAILFPRDAEKIGKRIDALVSIDPEYNFDVAAAKVQDLYQRRTCITQAGDLQAQMMDLAQTPNAALQGFRKNSVSLVEVGNKQATTPIGVMDRVDAIIHERMASDTKIIGYDFGKVLPILNTVLSGLQPTHQIIISANQGVGKSITALNMIRPLVLDQHVPWLWLNSEMDEVELAMRMISLESGINNSSLQMGKFVDHDQYMEYLRARDAYARGTLYIRKPVSGTIDEVYSIIEEFVFKYGIKGVTWDYAQLVQPSREQRGMSHTEVIGAASNVMTNRVAKTLGIVSMCISQLNRANYKKGEVRESENMGGAYKLAQDADDIIIVAEKSPEQIEQDGRNRGNRFINVDKRRGGTSNIVIHAELDDRNATTLRLRECMSPAELVGFSQMYGIGV